MSSAAATVPEPRSRSRRLHEALGRYTGVVLVLVVLIAWLASTQSGFLTVANFRNIFEASAAVFLVAIGVTFVMLVGGFDLSVGGTLSLSGVGLALLHQAGIPIGGAIAIVLIGAVLIGLLLNGTLIACLRLNFFVVTLGTASFLGGLALVLTDGNTEPLYHVALLHTLGSGSVLGIPWVIAIVGAVFLAGLWITHLTGFGQMIYAVGGNPEAARLGGINVVAVRMACYAIAAGLAGLAGIIVDAQLASAAPTAGAEAALAAATAVLIGGTSFYGGSGGLAGTLLGVLFIGTLSNGLTFAGIPSFWQTVVTGGVLVLAVALNRYGPEGPQQ